MVVASLQSLLAFALIRQKPKLRIVRPTFLIVSSFGIAMIAVLWPIPADYLASRPAKSRTQSQLARALILGIGSLIVLYV